MLVLLLTFLFSSCAYLSGDNGQQKSFYLIFLDADKTGIQYVNTTLLVSANFEKKFLNIILIPGSTKAVIPGTSYDQLRYAYSFGGGKLVQKVLNSLLDTKIERYIVTDQPLLANLIEAVGGLPLTMADEITTYVNYRYTIFPETTMMTAA